VSEEMGEVHYDNEDCSPDPDHYKICYAMLIRRLASAERKLWDLRRELPRIHQEMGDIHIKVPYEELRDFIALFFKDSVEYVLSEPEAKDGQ
jgi:hypothetical protein